ncbi:MAG TPA: D-glycero-beta-D-manno-heptose 1-phosphate adenylyltransferase, partial [Coxiellaceae bacterium]|nr:D-glycero-beta-D-manno-heptose 1-phosphate adenylyltransferase [Coxiellaceae bacterium]
VGQNQQLIRLDFEQLPFAIDEELLQDYEEKLQHVQVVILSDYAKGTLLNPLPFIARARKRGLPVLVDPKHVDFRLYRGATVITPNLKEFEQAVGHCHSEAEMVEKARELIHSCELGALLITRGKDGMLLIQAHEPPLAISATAREVYDVTGAGDTVIGLLGACLATGMSLSEAAKVANLAAGLVVGKLGAATVTVPELKRALLQAHDHHSGLLTQAQLLEVVSTAKAHGEKIVMTNGCFDILHAGHIQYLEQAKALGDYLIVAVNDDDSVRRLKGPLRPLNTLEDRLYTVASLRAVDAVIPFSEDTPAALVEAILPDYLVKGGDYRVEEIAGSATVIAAGGQVIILDFKPGCSTSGLLERIVERHSVGELS